MMLLAGSSNSYAGADKSVEAINETRRFSVATEVFVMSGHVRVEAWTLLRWRRELDAALWVAFRGGVAAVKPLGAGGLEVVW